MPLLIDVGRAITSKAFDKVDDLGTFCCQSHVIPYIIGALRKQMLSSQSGDFQGFLSIALNQSHGQKPGAQHLKRTFFQPESLSE